MYWGIILLVVWHALVGSMVIIVIVAIIEDVGCVIVFIYGQDMVRIDFFAYDKVLSGGIVELIYVLIRKELVGIAVVESAVVVGRGIRDVVVTSQARVGIVVVARLAIGGVRGIRGVVW